MAFNLDDLKDQLANSWRQSWEQFQESALFHQIKDRYENLTPSSQKLSLAGLAIAILLLLFSLPWSYFSQSSDFISEFETKRTVIRDLLKVSREAHENPDIPVPPPLESVRLQIDSVLKAAQLLPEQMIGIENLSEKSGLVPPNLMAGMLKISLSKLNLRQIVDIGYQIQAISPSLKVKDLRVEANAQAPKYFDVVFKLISLNVPQEQVAPPEPPEEPKKNAAKKDNKKGTKKDEADQ